MRISDTSPQTGSSSGRGKDRLGFIEDTALPDLLLPEHLRLGVHNWLEFKFAIEIILELRGISIVHLRCAKCPPPLPPVLAAGSEAETAGVESLARLKWAADDDLCKTIIVLNVRSDHMRLVEYNHRLCSAAELWALLVQRDEEIRREWERQVAWLCCIRTLAPWVFLVIVCVAWLLGA